MNTLVLVPTTGTLTYHYFAATEPHAAYTGTISDYRTEDAGMQDLAAELRRAQVVAPPEVIAILVPYGGESLRKPTLLDLGVYRRLEELVPESPLHLPAVLHLMRECERAYEGVPVVLDFDTGFFAALPRRESSYGISGELARSLKLRRYGYHGIFHEAAASRLRFPSESGPARPDLVVSICLEPQPELAAIVCGRPVMVTGGVTPLEGLPGETTCGEIDPSIVLALASQETSPGTEMINLVLTRQSGLSAVAGRRITIGELLHSTDPSLRLAYDILRYRILLACGAAKAAMGDVEAVVASGRYAGEAGQLLEWLTERLAKGRGRTGEAVPWELFEEELPRIIADRAEVAVSEARTSALPR